MRIGFTGTRKGMTDEQKDTLVDFLSGAYYKGKGESVFIHGGCVGADDEAAMIAGNIGYELWCLPSNLPSQQGSVMSKVTFPEANPLLRNQRIVLMSQTMIAMPKGFREELRSGTWATIRFAQLTDKNLIIVYPDGQTNKEIERYGT